MGGATCKSDLTAPPELSPPCSAHRLRPAAACGAVASRGAGGGPAPEAGDGYLGLLYVVDELKVFG